MQRTNQESSSTSSTSAGDERVCYTAFVYTSTSNPEPPRQGPLETKEYTIQLPSLHLHLPGVFQSRNGTSPRKSVTILLSSLRLYTPGLFHRRKGVDSITSKLQCKSHFNLETMNTSSNHTTKHTSLRWQTATSCILPFHLQNSTHLVLQYCERCERL